MVSVKFPGKDKNMPGKSFSRAVRKSHIVTSFVNRFKNGKKEEVTSAQVAKALMLEPSGHIRELLGELVRDGILDCRKVDNPHGHNLVSGKDENGKNVTGGHSFKLWFKLSDKKIAEIESEGHSVTIKKNGKEVGQLKLW